MTAAAKGGKTDGGCAPPFPTVCDRRVTNKTLEYEKSYLLDSMDSIDCGLGAFFHSERGLV